mmetsp:Transcript_87165/g.247424  ORF Transcript_87165/g.247424 Transcript_87165/m.247424 type:complete len:119 (-) Transcript_87165:181-537(-)
MYDDGFDDDGTTDWDAFVAAADVAEKKDAKRAREVFHFGDGSGRALKATKTPASRTLDQLWSGAIPPAPSKMVSLWNFDEAASSKVEPLLVSPTACMYRLHELVIARGGNATPCDCAC